MTQITNCTTCRFYNEDRRRCDNAEGTLYGILLTPSLAEADNGCSVYEEVRYRLTPAAILHGVMEDNGVDITFETAKVAVEEFFERMTVAGYLAKGEEGSDDETERV